MRDLRQRHGAGLHNGMTNSGADRFLPDFHPWTPEDPFLYLVSLKSSARPRIQLFCDAKMRYRDCAGRHTALFLKQ